MARIYREVAIEQMVLTVEEAMSRVLDWWGDLPPSMKEAIEQFRTELGAAIDSVEFVKKAFDTQAPETDSGNGLPEANCEFGGACRPQRGPAAEVADTALGKAVSRRKT